MSENIKNTPDDIGELLNGLDELTLGETETLLTGIDKVTLSLDEELLLKRKVLEKAGIEESEIMRKDERKEMLVGNPTRVKNKKHIRRALLCIAAVMVCSIVAVGASHMDGLQRFWGNDTEIYSERTIETIESVQNENIKFNIEGIVADKYQCVFVVSTEALTEEGRRIINSNTHKHYVFPMTIKPIFLSGDPNQGSSGIFQYTDDNKNKDYKAYRCDFELENVDLSQPVTIEFEGLSMQFDIPEFMEAITLYPEEEAEIELVELSSIGYYYKVEGMEADFAEVRLINQDGTLDEELGYQGGMAQEDDEEVMVIGSFTELVDLKNYSGIQLDGVNYTAK